jgi:hypothetical protein
MNLLNQYFLFRKSAKETALVTVYVDLCEPAVFRETK